MIVACICWELGTVACICGELFEFDLLMEIEDNDMADIS
jgi:hypothetical protein